MVGFPLEWREEWLGARAASPSGCCVSVAVIERYLATCHQAYLRDEPDLVFSPLTEVEHWDAGDRRFWLWRCDDSLDREWFIMAGDGASPFAGEGALQRRWIFAETNEQGLSPLEFLGTWLRGSDEAIN